MNRRDVSPRNPLGVWVLRSFWESVSGSFYRLPSHAPSLPDCCAASAAQALMRSVACCRVRSASGILRDAKNCFTSPGVRASQNDDSAAMALV